MPDAVPAALVREERPFNHATVGALITGALAPMPFSDGEAALVGL